MEDRFTTCPRSSEQTLILDLGDVLFCWTTEYLTALSRSAFHNVILTPTWAELECGKINECEALAKIGEELSIEPGVIHEALAQCRKTLRVDEGLLVRLRELKASMQGCLKVNAMSNITKDDFTLLQAALPDWRLFDGVYTSFEVGLVKPELSFYKHVLADLKILDATSVIFVDDKVVNVSAAQSFGIRGIVFHDADALMRQLRNMLLDPAERGREYLVRHARELHSEIENGPEIRDVFSQFLIHTELRDTRLINLSRADTSPLEIEDAIKRAASEARTWNYFIDPPIGTTTNFPDDVDDTAYALLSFSPPPASADPILDKMLAIRHGQDGLVQIYFDEKRPRVCPVVLVNVLRVFYHFNRGADVKNELDYLRDILMHRGYVNGSLHYLSAEPFLFFLSRLIMDNPDKVELQSLRASLVTALRQRVGRHDDSFAVAARVLACQAMGVWADSDVCYLKEMQMEDGGWEIGWICRFGRSKKRIGSRGVITAFTVKALEHEAKYAQ